LALALALLGGPRHRLQARSSGVIWQSKTAGVAPGASYREDDDAVGTGMVAPVTCISCSAKRPPGWRRR
jgi:hypothetical protein